MGVLIYPEDFLDCLLEKDESIEFSLGEHLSFVIGKDEEFNLPCADLEMEDYILPMSPLLIISDLETMIKNDQGKNAKLRLEFIDELNQFNSLESLNYLKKGIESYVKETNMKIYELNKRVDNFSPLKFNLKIISSLGIYGKFIKLEITDIFNDYMNWDLIHNISKSYSQNLIKDNNYLKNSKLDNVISQYNLLTDISGDMRLKVLNSYKSACNILTENKNSPPYLEVPNRMFRFLQNQPI